MSFRKMKLALVCLMGLAAFNGCGDKKPNEVDVLGDVYILNEGGQGANNASLSCYNSKTKKLLNDCFLEKNKRGLGELAIDLKVYGGKLYCVVDGSSTVEVMDVYTGKSVKQIPLFEGSVGKSPRRIAFWQNKAYVCCFDGTVVRIDTASLSVEKSVKVGRNPEDLCVSNGKLYVTNSGGLDFPNYDSTVSVVDLSTFTELKKISVGVNPSRIAADNNGNVFLLVMGNYYDIPTVFKCISSQTDTVTHSFDIAASNFTISGNTAYLYQYDYGAETYWVKEFNVLSKTITKDNFFSETVDLQTPYGIAVDASNGDVYITDARNFKESGDVYCFGSNGKKKFVLSVGQIPNNVVVVK
jgi:YVTN family beta-propeller protein